MYLLKAIDHYKRHKRRKYSETVYELLCRVHLTGILDLGCAYLRFWESPFGLEPYIQLDPRRARAVYLKTRLLKEENNAGKVPANKNEQYYIPGGLANEIAILMTLFTRAHFVLSRRLNIADIPFLIKYANEEDVAKGDMDGKDVKLEDNKIYFNMFEGLRLRESSEKGSKLRRLEPFMLAARFYHLAFSLTNRDTTLAYISLICAIEALLHDYDIKNFSLDDWNKKAAKLIKSYVSNYKKYQEIKQAIITRPIRIKQRFKKFIVEHITDKFWSDPTRPGKKNSWVRFKDLTDIEEYLDRIYEARSNALHEGRPFPPSGGELNAERPTGSAMWIGDKEWKEKELVPPIRAFERIVHHVLIEYLRRESKKGFESFK